ncbi:hypothetical protein BDV38DRAFT_295845 [Aspergillus pseudotamarii]|uniref:GATA-type domain-containing protein n=1 Tax=Aspergillus pseudotamarii TaxID=132259 RepID=A0A5N6SKI2_ASPPS|nr:uncharacterized protein BDV38DRAFT_295845 [Aspergillus pseudotamarii]KAE8133903.1 hypothetical protein BDV38DRAFT_295845 [Aspergillus pseudotamarii]
MPPNPRSGASTNDHAHHDRDTVITDEALDHQSAVGIHKGAREKSQLRQGPEAEEKPPSLREGLDEQSRTKSAEIGEKSSSRQGYQRLMSSRVKEKSSLCPSPKTTAAGGKTRRGKKDKRANVPSNQRSILSYMRPAEEAGETSEPLQTGCITAGKRPAPTEAVAENASDSKRAKLIKQEPVVSVKTEEELEDILDDIKEEQEEVPFNPEDYADAILIEDDEYPDELKHEDAAGYDVEEDSLPEHVYQEAGYLEEEGFISDEDRYRLAGIADEDHEALRESFDKSMHRVIRYLFNYAKYTPFKELKGGKSWIAPAMYQWLQRADSEVVYRLYQAIIPESTRTILGHDKLIGKHILALPKVSPSRRDRGVYLDLVTSPGEDGGLYTGSTKISFVVRIPAHQRAIQGGESGAHYTYIREKADRKPHFRVVAVFPRRVPELGIESADSVWLIRFLETVIMIVLDTFTPGSRPIFSVPQDRLDHMRSECGLRDTGFQPLNRALPTKQPIDSVRSKAQRKCPTCGDDKPSNWCLDYNPSTWVAIYLCSACFQWKRTHGTDRPASLYNRLPQPTSGPCSNPNCGATETTRKWYRDPNDKDRVLCDACHTYQTLNSGKIALKLAQASYGFEHMINPDYCTGAKSVTTGMKGAYQKPKIILDNASVVVNQILKTGTEYRQCVDPAIIMINNVVKNGSVQIAGTASSYGRRKRNSSAGLIPFASGYAISVI